MGSETKQQTSDDMICLRQRLVELQHATQEKCKEYASMKREQELADFEVTASRQKIEEITNNNLASIRLLKKTEREIVFLKEASQMKDRKIKGLNSAGHN